MPELTARRRLSQRPAQGPQGESASAMAFLAAIGREVRRQRAKRGMTRRQLAQASQTSERYLAQIESGAGNPSVSVLRAIAQALDLPAAALLPEQGARTAELGAILDLLAPVRTGRSASRSSVCGAPANRRSGACSPSTSARPSSNSTAASRRITAPA